MKERGGPHYVGQQLAFLSPQDYSSKLPEHLSQGFKTQGQLTQNGVTTFGQVTSAVYQPVGTAALMSNNNSLNVVQFPPQASSSGMVGKKKFVHSGSVSASNDQKQLHLAEMVKSSGVIKQSSFQKKEAGPLINSMQQDFIKGTQVQKDFQLVAEPLIPKAAMHQQNVGNSHSLKGQQSSSSSYSNTGISTSNGSGLMNQDKQSLQGQNNTANNPFNSQHSSRKNLESLYSTDTVKPPSDIMQNQNIQQLIQNSQINYSTNRSVAAKAGQMQIFSTDKYSQLGSSASNQNTTKFQSPGKGVPHHHHSMSTQNNGKVVAYHQSASQQIESMMDLQQLKQKSAQQQNNKLNDYLNRFQTSTSIDNTQNLQMKYRDLRDQILQQDEQNKYNYIPSESLSAAETTSIEQQPNVIYTQKRSPVMQKENKFGNGGGNFGISGEQMHLEEKTFLKKMGGIVGTSIDQGNSSQRHAGSSRKGQDLQINAKGINRGFRGGVESQNLALQPRTRYDYVFVRINEDLFEREFYDKITFTREPACESPTISQLKNKRISSMALNSGNKNEGSQLQMLQKQTKSLRGSQEFNKDAQASIFSPLHKNPLDGFLPTQNIQTDIHKYPQAPSPKVIPNTCSIISTNHTHIKVITHQGIITPFADLTPDQIAQQQISLNDCVSDVMTKVQEKGRVVKTTQKKKYILNALNAAHMRVASIYVIVLDNNLQFMNENPDLRATLMSDSSTTSSNNFNKTLTKLQNTKALQRGGLSKKEVMIAKNMRIRNNSTINSKGYESESEVKSTNSTTTSSTLQQFIPTRNFEQNNGSNTTKNSSRSLSQKGTQPRKGFQAKPQAQIPSEEQFIVSKDGVVKKYPPTKIKILSPYDYNHHDTHRINVCLNNYNQFIQLCFKNKGKVNVMAVVKLGKQLGVPISSAMFTDGVIKSREQANMLKEKLIAYLCKVINEENQPENMPDNPLVQEAIAPLGQPLHQYKCYVGKGNNSILIRTLFKTRFWWLLHDKEEIEKVNFMWTQLRKNPIMDTFPCKFEDKKSGLRTHGASGSSSSVMQTPGKLKQKKKMMMQSSSLSLDSSGGANSTEKKESSTSAKLEAAVISQPQPQVSQALQQLSVKLYNKLEDNFHLSNKKAMFLNIRLYYEAMGKDVFNAVPMTFHVKEGLEDQEFLRFKQYYLKEEEEIKKQKANKQLALQPDEDGNTPTQVSQSIRRNIWIVKPGENTNRGQGITVLKDLDDIKALIQESTATRKRTCIVQKYIHNPLLINKRKFDIRLYAFMSSINGNMKGYFYSDGYLRTSCREFTLQNLSNRMIHLTNDAVQKHAEDYGKYEAGNKLSYTDFQNYLDKNYADLNICFERDLLPQMKKLVTDTFRAVYGKLDPKRRINTFEIYGYDFMFDDDFKVYLIEVNTNPCLELGCPLLARLIPTMVENALRLAVDPLFPAPENWSQKKCVVNDICPENKFELIYDEKVDGPYLTELMKEKKQYYH